MSLRAVIFVISDTASQDPSTDKCGDTLKGVYQNQQASSWEITEVKIIPDDIQQIQQAVTAITDGPDAVNAIITSGGTGFALKDKTPEAISPLIHRHAPGLVHGMLAASLQVTPFAMMSRPVAGVRNKTLIATLPGSPKGAKENLEAIIKLLPHACLQSAGGDSRSLHAGGMKKLEQDAGVSSSSHSLRQDHSHSHSHSHQHHGHGGHGHAGPKPHTTPSERPSPNDPSAGPSSRNRKSPYAMLCVSEALSTISAKIPSPHTATLPVTPALLNHVLAEDVAAVESVPAFRASIVDGYAVKCDFNGKNRAGVYPVAFAAHAHAGDAPEPPTLESGTVVRITTGAPLPVGADAVVMVEDTLVRETTSDGREEVAIEILTSEVSSGENVREIGSDVAAGSTVMRAGEGVSALGGEFGLLASIGVRTVAAYVRPVVGVLSTGDEIIPAEREGALRLGEVRDTNRPTLIAAARRCGFEVVDLGIVEDKPTSLEAALRLALHKCDVLITSGGVSMGEYDLLKPTLERALSGTIHFGRVAMKPGKPTTFATVPSANVTDASSSAESAAFSSKAVFSLPGNPASAVVTFHLFVLPALHQMAGVKPVGLPRVNVRLDAPVKCDASREEYHRVFVGARAGEEGLYAVSTGGQRSSRIGSFKGANALLVLPAGGGTLDKGQAVEALLMSGPGML